MALRPVFAGSSKDANSYRCPDRFRAVIDVERDHAFAIVTTDYELIANQMEYELSEAILKRVFRQTALENFECFNVTMPNSRSFCHIDLVDSAAGFHPWTNDKWTAFLRITNSYNRTRRLRFQLGFCRWICRNGMIFGAKSVEFSNSHTRSVQAGMLRFIDTIENIRAIEEELKLQLHRLRALPVPKDNMLSIFCSAFGVRVEEALEEGSRRAKQLARMRQQVDALTAKYFGASDHHGYAAPNILTDYATSPDGVISRAGSIDRLQRRAADWIPEILKKSSASGFSWDCYLKEYRESGLRLSKLR